MEDESRNVLVKSEKRSQKKKKRIVWAISLLLVAATIVTLIVPLIIDYSGYKKGQKFGLASMVAVSELSSTSWVDKNDSYAEQCKTVYRILNMHTYDMIFNGAKFDASDLRKSEDATRSAFANVMQSAGYDRFSSYNIADWFKYTNIVDYSFGYYGEKIIPICCCIVLVLLISLVFTISVNREEKKELVVYEDSVLCRITPKKSKQLIFEDINNVDFGNGSLKLAGTGFKFKISNLTNVENLKSVIIEKKHSSHGKTDSSNAGNADELKKYKELLDNGVISQEEFDSKKKQILGL